MQNENSWKVFYSIVKNRCEKLIEYGIWQGIDTFQFKSWLNNFKSDREKLFSALILDSLIYRSEEQVKSMLFDLLTRDLHNTWRISNDSLYEPNNNPLTLLKRRNPSIDFRIVTAVKSSDPDTKSGYHIVFLLNHCMDVRSEWIIKPSEIESYYRQGISCFILLDDISCTGEQMDSILEEINISKYPDARFYVGLCTMHKFAYKVLTQKYSRIKFIYTEFLDDSNNFFESLPINETSYSDKEDAIEKYMKYLKDKNIKSKPELGKGELGLTYAFSHNVPNNSLPILYYENDRFKKLINKRP